MEKAKPELPTLLFETPEDLSTWLTTHGATSSGVWLRLAKKDSTLHSITYAQALEVALCHGWIDGQKKAFDTDSWLQKFTPRRAKSIWSQINRDKAIALIASGQMKAAGLREVELAQNDGRWDAAYAPASSSTVPQDLQVELNKNPAATEFFSTLKGANRYAILFRIHNVKKAETRAKRIQQFVAMLERGETIYPKGE